MTKSLPYLAAAATVLVTACAQQTTPDEASVMPVETSAKTDKPAEYATVKPGAAVDIAHVLRGPVKAGGQGVVDLIISEDYSGGVLTLEVNGGDGLTVLGASVSKSFQMGDTAEHSWSVNFGAPTDGVHYLRIRANAAPDDGPASSRSFAIRVDVGDISKVAPNEKSVTATTTLEGEAVIIMEAEETIE